MKTVYTVLLLMLTPVLHAQEAAIPTSPESPDVELSPDDTQQLRSVPLRFIDVIEANKMLRALKLVDDDKLHCQPDTRINQLVLRGRPARIAEALTVLEKIDSQPVPLEPPEFAAKPKDLLHVLKAGASRLAEGNSKMSIGERQAQAELRNLKLQQLQLQQQLGANHPKLKMIEKQIEIMEARAKMVRELADQLNEAQPSKDAAPALIEEAVLKIRPDLNVEIEKVVGGVVVIRGEREDIDTFSQLVESIRVLVSDSSVEQLQDEYEQTEKQVEAIADRVREIENDDELREEQKTELRRLVRRMFSLRMTIQQSQLDEAQADLNASQARLERRQLLAERIIARRVEDLISGEEEVPAVSVSESGSPKTPENILDYKCQPNDILRVVVPGVLGTVDSPATLVIDHRGYLRLPNGHYNPASPATVAVLEELIHRALIPGRQFRKDQTGSVIVEVQKFADFESIADVRSEVEIALSEVRSDLSGFNEQLTKLSRENTQVFNGEEIVRIAAEESARIEIELATIESQMSELKRLEESTDGNVVTGALKELRALGKKSADLRNSDAAMSIREKADDARHRVEARIFVIAGEKYFDFTCLEDARLNVSQRIETLGAKYEAIERKAVETRAAMSRDYERKKERREVEQEVTNHERLEGTLVDYLEMLNRQQK